VYADIVCRNKPTQSSEFLDYKSASADRLKSPAPLLFASIIGLLIHEPGTDTRPNARFCMRKKDKGYLSGMPMPIDQPEASLQA